MIEMARKTGKKTAVRIRHCSDGQADEYATFSSALKKVLTISHTEMQKRITRASAARASNAKD